MILRITLVAPPAGVDFGVQKGKGPAYETILKQRSGGGDVAFEFDVPVKNGALAGPLVQGPKGERFVYIDIGTCAGQMDSCWSRRLKVPLQGVDCAAAVCETRVPGTAKDGGPNCATVKPFAGWTAMAP